MDEPFLWFICVKYCMCKVSEGSFSICALFSSEYNQSFTLSINRNHRGFRRVVMSKGLKLELLHKGGFLRSDKPIGTALVKLDKLESQSEVREIVEVSRLLHRKLSRSRERKDQEGSLLLSLILTTSTETSLVL